MLPLVSDAVDPCLLLPLLLDIDPMPHLLLGRRSTRGLLLLLPLPAAAAAAVAASTLKSRPIGRGPPFPCPPPPPAAAGGGAGAAAAGAAPVAAAAVAAAPTGTMLDELLMLPGSGALVGDSADCASEDNKCAGDTFMKVGPFSGLLPSLLPWIVEPVVPSYARVLLGPWPRTRASETCE